MKILHTSDWHLGKKLLGKDLVPFQDVVLDEIAAIAEAKSADIVLVSGGIFDGAVPTPESIGLFLKAVEKITDGGKRAMVVTLGGSDSVAALQSFSHLSKRYNLAIFTSGASVIDFDGENEYDVKPVESGRGYIVYTNKQGETAVVAALCPKTFDIKNDETYLAALQRNIDSATRKFSHETFNIVVGDLKMRLQSDLMTDDDVPGCEIFPYETTYVALGGLHRNEICDMDRNAYYCGSILPYDSDDTKGEKAVLVATFNEAGEVRKEMSKLKTSKKFKRVKCSGLDDADTQLYKYDDCFVDLSLSVFEPISYAENVKLFSDHPNLVQLSLTLGAMKGEKKKRSAKIGMSDGDLFKGFLQDTAPNTYDGELGELFASVMEELK